MKFSMYMTENAIQFNLQPENEHERKFVKMIRLSKGEVEIHNGVDINETRGGYLRNFGQRESEGITAITIKPLKELLNGDGE